jgi:signal transduction histidine kinase
MSSGNASKRKPIWLGGAVVLLAGMVTLAALVLSGRISSSANSETRDQDFSHANAWNAQGGSWAADASGIENSSAERGAKLIARAGTWKDFQIDTDIQITESFGAAGVILRSSGEEEGVDAYHGYYAGIRTMDSSVEFGRADFGWHSIAHANLTGSADLHGWFHLRAVAAGCKFGIEVTAPGGGSSAFVVEDHNCIPSGTFGLRSSSSSAKWKNLRVSNESVQDLAAIETAARNTPVSHDLLLLEPTEAGNVQSFVTSVRDEAVKHQIQPKVTSISYYRLLPGPHPNVTIVGSIISLPPVADIQDSTGTIIVPNLDPATPIKLGDVVEAQGTLVSGHFRSWLENAKLRVLWSDEPYPPLAVTAEQLTGGTYRGRFIEVEGTLVSAQRVGGGYELVLKDGDQTFSAFGQSDFHVDPAALEPGSRLRLRGNATSLDQFTHGVYPFIVAADHVDVVSSPPWWTPIHVLWLVLACFAVLILIQWTLHRIQAWHVRSLLKEREELAFEMHDTLAQSFTGIAYQLQAATLERRGEREVQEHVQNALKMVDMSHREASRTIAALRPQYREASDIVVALRELADRLSDAGGLQVKTEVRGKDSKLPLAITDAFFRIGQEAVTNAIQHAACKELEIVLELSATQAQLTVRDNGRGMSMQAESSGLGIAGMKSRATKIKARFECTPGPSGGTCVVVTAPLPRARGFLSRALAFLQASFTSRESFSWK